MTNRHNQPKNDFDFEAFKEQVKAEAKAEAIAEIQKKQEEQKENSLVNKLTTYLKNNSQSTYTAWGAGGTMLYMGYTHNDPELLNYGISTIAGGTFSPDLSTIGKVLKSLKS
jgi:hypothetical protein